MSNLIAWLDQLDFLVVVWLLPVAFLLHEAEEWKIIGWYERNYVDLPAKTNTSTRTFLVFASVVGFVWTAVAALPGDPRLAAFVLLPAAAVVLLNALQHVFWLFLFREYAPGVVSSVLLLIPTISYLAFRAVDQGHVPAWYLIVLGALIVPGFVQTIAARNRLTAQFRAIHNFSVALSRWLMTLNRH